MIRVFIVDDSSFSRKLLRRVIEATTDIRIVGEADSGHEAISALSSQEVDIVTLDVNLPDMSGLEVLREVRARWPAISVLMLSALTHEGARTTVEALTLGAVDFIDKTKFGSFDVIQLGDQLLSKLRSIGPIRGSAQKAAGPSRQAGGALQRVLMNCEICVIGASTGGPVAVQGILQALSAPPPFPVVVAQHMPPGFTREFARRLATICPYEVREAVADERLEPGTAYVAPGGMHMTVGSAWTALLRRAANDGSATPSVDALFSSVADLGVRSCGVLLTGMGRDGAKGLEAIRARGGLTIGQDASSCVVYGMPRAAAELGAVEHQLSLAAIIELFRGLH